MPKIIRALNITSDFDSLSMNKVHFFGFQSREELILRGSPGFTTLLYFESKPRRTSYASKPNLRQNYYFYLKRENHFYVINLLL